MLGVKLVRLLVIVVGNYVHCFICTTQRYALTQKLPSMIPIVSRQKKTPSAFQYHLQLILAVIAFYKREFSSIYTNISEKSTLERKFGKKIALQNIKTCSILPNFFLQAAMARSIRSCRSKRQC